MALPVIHTAHLLRETDRHLVDLLGSLEPREWEMPSIVPGWAVRDIAAHLLDTALRKLSMLRDHWFVERVEIRCAQDVVDLVNRLNREGVAVYRRLSPALLLEMMASACEQSADLVEVNVTGEQKPVRWKYGDPLPIALHRNRAADS